MNNEHPAFLITGGMEQCGVDFQSARMCAHYAKAPLNSLAGKCKENRPAIEQRVSTLKRRACSWERASGVYLHAGHDAALFFGARVGVQERLGAVSSHPGRLEVYPTLLRRIGAW